MKLRSSIQASEFDPKPIAPRPVLEGPLAALLAADAAVVSYQEQRQKLQAARKVRDNRQRADLAHTLTDGDDEIA